MQNYDDTNEREYCLADSLKELDKVNKKISQLTLRKEELTASIIGALGHEHEGQKQYDYNGWKVEVKTPFIYSLNKKMYESGEYNLPDEFNPIKESISYTVDKRLLEKYLDDAPVEVRDALVDLIEKKPGKAGVVIKERV